MKRFITIFVSLAFLILPFSYASVCAYTDVRYDHWAYTAINKLSEMGVLNGYSDGSFRPSQSITRAEFCKIIVELLGDKAVEQNGADFQDVTRFHWANEYIKKASGYFGANKNRFYPDSPLLREDAALAMVNVLGKQNQEVDVKILHRFLDDDLISEEYEKYIAIAVENGIMNGNADGTFNPLGNVTRAEMCQIIYNSGLNVSSNNSTNNSTNSNTNTNASTNTNKNIIVDENGVVIVKPIANNYSSSDICLDVRLEGNTLRDGGTYTIGKEEYIIASIGNPSSEKNFIYYSFAYGANYQTIVVQKVASSSAEIIIPEELIGKNVRISIWGSSTKNGKGYMTATQIFTFKYSEDLSHRGESYSDNYSEKFENRKPDFILLFNGITIAPDSTVEDVKPGQVLIIRSRPVANIQSINYRWDKDIDYKVVNHATESIEIPNTFASGTTHKLTVRIVDKDGKVYMPRVFKFTMYGKTATSNEG